MGYNQNNSVAAVIVAAGRGERAGGSDGPKQYRKLAGKTVLSRSVQPFLSNPNIETVIVVIHPDDRDLYNKSISSDPKLLTPVLGGATRQLSVAAGLEGLLDSNPDHVLIHDAARPFVDDTLIYRVIEGISSDHAALPAVPVADTLKRGDDRGIVVDTVPRESLHAAQTPQGFSFIEILNAHRNAQAAGRADFTDDSALAEWSGIKVALVEGDTQNTKLTTADDMKKAEEAMAGRTTLPDIRVGHGYDTHQFTDGKTIWLCGVEIPHTHSLEGHSDADVGLHALTDALLAAIADGDIGSHFPPSDPKWKGARSDQFLKHAVERVVERGGVITHMDVTLVCEAPKIGPHRDAMRQVISTCSGVNTDRISVKATTNERIGFIGRNEGMVAFATATVVMGNLK